MILLSLTIVFSSAIFFASLAIFYSFSNIFDDIYGDYENVVVVYDQNANTPFTSSVSKSLKTVFEEIDGVKIVSGELIAPVIVKNQPSYIRGVDWEAFSSIVQIKNIEGEIFAENDKSSVIIGKDLAERLDIEIGDFINLDGTIRNRNMVAKVKGIITTDTKRDEEIITSLDLSRGLSAKVNDYTHLLVSYDPKIISEVELINFYSKLYEIKINARILNGSQFPPYWQLDILNHNNELIHTKINEGEVSVFLPLGEYQFIGIFNNRISPKYKFLIEDNMELIIDIDKKVFEFDFTVYDHNQEYTPNIFYDIINTRQEISASGYTDLDGYAKLELIEEGYYIRFWKEDIHQSFYFVVLNTSSQFFYLEEFTGFDIKINGLYNGSIIPDKSGIFTLNKYSPHVKAFLGYKPLSIYNNLISYDTVYGSKVLKIEYFNKTILYNFNIVESLNYLQPIGFSNNSHHRPNSTLSFNFTGLDKSLKIETSLCYNSINHTVSSENILEFTIPNTIQGHCSIDINAHSTSGLSYNASYIIFVETNASDFGFQSINNRFSIIQGDQIPIWHNKPIQFVKFNDTTLEILNSQINTTSLSIGNYQVYFNYNDSYHLSQYKIEITDTYSNQIIIKNDTLSSLLSENIPWYSDNLQVDFDPYQFEIFISTSNYHLKINPNQNFPIKINLEEVTTIQIHQLLTNYRENISLVASPTLNQFVPIINNEFIHGFSTGMIDLQSYYDDNLTWSFDYYNENNQLNQNIRPLINENRSAQLQPGTWQLTIYGSIHTSTLSVRVWVQNWTTQVNSSQDMMLINRNNKIYLNESLIFIQLNNAIYFNTDTQFIGYFRIAPTSDPFAGFNVTSDMNITIMMKESIFDARFQIQNGEEFSRVYKYNGSELISFEKIGIYYINVTAIDYFGNILNTTRMYLIGINKTYSHLEPLTGHQTEEKYSLSILSLSSGQQVNFSSHKRLFNLQLFPGRIYIEIKYKNIISKNYVDIPYTNDTFSFEGAFLNKKISIFNQNTGRIVPFSGNLNITSLDTGQNFIMRYDKTLYLNIQPGTYKLEAKFVANSGYLETTLSTIENLILPGILINDSGSVQIVNSEFVVPNNIQVVHELTEVTRIVTLQDGFFQLIDFPIGWVNVHLRVGNYEFILKGWFQPPIQDNLLVLTVDAELIDIGDWASSKGTLLLSGTGELSGNALKGPLGFIIAIVVVQVIIISTALLVNMSGVFAGYISENKREILIVRNIGFTKNQIIFSLLRNFIKIGFSAVVFGILLGFCLTEILFMTNNTILFGHKFKPVYTLFSIFLDIGIMGLLSYIGINIGLKMEIDENL